MATGEDREYKSVYEMFSDQAGIDFEKRTLAKGQRHDVVLWPPHGFSGR
jgi:hypothetical protein